jgi:hypothetical protein
MESAIGSELRFSGLNTLTGEVLSGCAQRHCHQEWLTILHKIWSLDQRFIHKVRIIYSRSAEYMMAFRKHINIYHVGL